MSYRDREQYRDRERRDYSDRHWQDRPGPDQYGQEHYGRRQYNPQHEQDANPLGQSQFGHRQYGGREPRGWQPRDNPSFSQEPSGHVPFTHSAFGESNPPRYFGTGSQGHGGGPSFTGGTYGNADWRSDAPYFDEVGFNRGNYENPLGREPQAPLRYGQSYTGRQQRRYPLGPKGYTRSDERLTEDISERLMQAYDVDSSDVTVRVTGGKVVLEGTVPTRFMKHAIEDIADSAPGVQDVDNRIRVGAVTVSSPTTATSK